MRILELEDFLKERPEDKRLMGLDVSRNVIGIAVADAALILATPVTTLRRNGLARDLDALEALVREYDSGSFVIGYPLNMDGSEGPRCQSLRDFARNLSERFPAFPILLHDERLSTQEARDLSEDFGFRRKGKSSLDDLAAQVILEDAISKIRNVSRTN